jgi:6-phosphogluconolactonase (cycloisomerase 2 family)
MKFRFLRYVLLPTLLLGLAACSTNHSTVTSGAGVLYVTAQGNSTVSAFSLNLGSGALSALGSSAATGSVPAAIAVTPSIDALFVANSASNTISSYTVNTDGSLTAVSGSTPAGLTPTSLAIDPAGKFLFVANQGWNNDPNSGRSSVSVFAISGTGLKQVSGSPFTTIPAGFSYPNGTLPSGVVVSASGKFLYVANELANFVSAFSVNSSGALTPLGVSFYNTGLGPAGLAITPNGGFLYAANSGSPSDSISAFAICDAVVTSCTDVNNPDGKLTEVKGSPFPAGLGPVAIAVDPGFNFVYAVDKGSNQISQYSYATGTGILTPLSPGSVSTGATPVSIAVRSGATGTNVGNTTTNPTDFVYVANSCAGTFSTFTVTTSSGLLSVVSTPFVTAGQTSAVAVK